MPSLKDRLKGLPALQPKGPLWRGPEQDGITFSLLSKWLQCKERFRLYVVEGLRAQERFDHRIFFGDAWHVCEEHHAAGGDWAAALTLFARSACRRYPLEQEQVAHWTQVCRVTFPAYVQFWAEHPDVLARTPLLQEQVFNVPYRLPSGRTVRLRGKFDSVDVVGRGKDAGIVLMENKTKGVVEEAKILRQMVMDMQTMLYLVALSQAAEGDGSGIGDAPRGETLRRLPLKGVRYNVVRRPLSGGKGTIVRKEATQGSKCQGCDGKGRRTPKVGLGKGVEIECIKCLGAGRVGGKPAETADEYYARVASYIEAEPETYFYRWNVTVTPGDIANFRRRCLDPLLEGLCDWWDWVSAGDPWRAGNRLHSVHPFGCYNVLDEGGSTDLDEYLATGSEAGLRRVGSLFPELE